MTSKQNDSSIAHGSSSKESLEQVSLLILKVGGSLFSDKRKDRTVDEKAIAAYAHLIADLAKSAPRRLVFISGGGSFGHSVARTLDPSDSFSALDLTEANFALKWIWTQALRKEGVHALPFQLTAICAFDNEGLIVRGEILRRAIERGIVPVLSGDCLIAQDGWLHILPSDQVSQIPLVLMPGPKRIVMLTDVPGVLKDGPGGSRVYRYINPDAPDIAFQALWDAPLWDKTQSMTGKLKSLIEFARRGAECFILKGDLNLPSINFLFEPVDRWPQEILYTRIALMDTSSEMDHQDSILHVS